MLSPVSCYGPDSVEILRDSWGIPHVFAETSEGVFFGLGYATAQDRMFQMEYSRRMVQGRISEIIGQGGVESDKLWRILGWYRIAKQVAQNLDYDTKKLLNAYATGVNKYMRDCPDSLIYLFSKYGIQPEPWTAADSIACWYRISLRFSGIGSGEVSNLHTFEQLVQEVGWEQAIVQMSPSPIIDESGATVKREDMDSQLIVEIEQYAREHGYDPNGTQFLSTDDRVLKASHAWVVSGQKSLTGSAMLHSDPQIFISAPSVWYEFHVCGGDFDARGIGVAGAPGMLIGWNRNVAWGATALGGDLSDLFRLQVNPSDLNQYYCDGAYRDMETYEERIVVKGGEEIVVTSRRTIWGFVVTPLISGAGPDEEFALKHAEVDNLNVTSLQAMIRIMGAVDWESFGEATKDYMSPGIHVVYADRYGNIGYQMLAGIPLRSSESPLGGRVAQYGNSSVYNWQELIPKKYLPHTFNPSSGVIVSANNMAVGSWYPLPLLLGTGGTGDTIRSWRLRETLESNLFSQQDMLKVHRDTVDPIVREIVRLARHIVHDLGDDLSSGATSALEVLETWNGQYNSTQAVYPLIENFNLMFRQSTTPLVSIYGGGEAGLCYFAKTIKQKLDMDPKYVPTEDEKNYVDSLLQNSWFKTTGEYGDDPSRWLERYDKTILIQYQNNLENLGSLDSRQDLTSPELVCKHTSTILSQHGNSYSQNVRFDDVDASLSVMPPGISENPQDPFFADQIPIWSSGELHEAPLSRERIEEMLTSVTELQYTRLSTDLNSDGIVDIRDVTIVAVSFGSSFGDPKWNDIADLDKNNVVNIIDITLVAKDYGKTT